MKKIQAKVSEKTLIADIYISDAEKNIIGYSCTMIAEEYMKKNHPDTKEWGFERDISSKRDENGNWNETWKISIYTITKGLEFTDME